MHVHAPTYEHASLEAHRVSDAREAEREVMRRVCPVEAQQPRFTYRIERIEGYLLTRRRIVWMDGLTGEERAFEDGDWAGAVEWRKSQEHRS